MREHPVRTLVLWSSPSAANLGVRVLAEGAVALLRRVRPDLEEVEFQTFDAAEFRSMLSTKALLAGIVTRSGSLRDYLSSFDLVVETGGGDSFADIYGFGRLARMVHVHRAAAAAGVPLIFAPQTIGPFSRRVARRMAARSLSDAAVVLSRDSISSSYSDSSLGRPVDATGTDVVFALGRPADRAPLDVIVNVSGLLWQANPHVDHESYRASVRSLISGLLNDGRRVAILAHVLDNASADNDVPAVLSVANEFDARVETIIPADLAEARSAVAAANIVIGSRMHACLNALSCGTAAYPWAYSRKFLPLLHDVGWTAGLDLRTSADPAAETLEYLRVTGSGGHDAQLKEVSRVTTLKLEDAASALMALLESEST